MQAVAKSQKIKKSTSTKVFYVICYVFVALMALVCLLPFVMVVSGSFSSEQAIRFQGYGILPRDFTTAAYSLIIKSPMTVVRAYGVSIFITLVGTAIGLLLTTMTAYVISRKDFKYRNALKRANPAKAERLFGKNEQEAKDRYTYLNKLVKLYGAVEE